MSAELENLDKVIARLDSVADTAKYEAALNKACMIVERSAKQKAPKGELRNSIASRVEELTGIVYTPLYFAPYVEYGTGLYAENGKGRQQVPWVYVEGSTPQEGKAKTIHTEQSADEAVAYLRSKGLEAYKTSGQHPQPYLRPALHENREKIMEILKEGAKSD
jgi:HK97 gp10 family phage protein